MKKLINTLLFCSALFYTNAQDLSKLEKEAEKLVEYYKNNNETDFKKNIISKKDYLSLYSENKNADSSYNEIVNNLINNYNSIIKSLRDEGIELSTISYNTNTYKVSNKENGTIADVSILVNTYKGDKTFTMKYAYANKKWQIIGSVWNGLDFDRICDCISKMDNLEKDSECIVYLESLEPIIKELDDEDRDELMKRVMDCTPKDLYVPDYDSEDMEQALEEAAEEVIDAAANEAKFEELSEDQKEALKKELISIAPNYCDCLNQTEENEIAGCKEAGEKLSELMKNKSESEMNYIIKLITDCRKINEH